MKKIQIVTVYNSINPGSFLQATALYHFFEKNGYEVSFMDTGARNLFTQVVLSVVYTVKRKNITQIPAKIKLGLRYKKQLDGYRVEKTHDTKNTVFVLGSDEIWNVARKDMARYPIFWGDGLPLSQCISYAPSLNNATEEDLMNYSFVQAAMNGLYAVSVRDKYSQKTLKKYADREIEVVCDPTVLLQKSDYEKIESRCDEKNYLLIYIYNRTISEAEIAAICRFAREKGLKILAFNQDCPWCDKIVRGTAIDFLTYISHADYICTSTFHGTMLSAIYGKKFAVMGNKNRKVSELLATLEINCRADENSLENILEHGYDTEKLKQRLTKLRASGVEYLQRNMEAIGE